MPSYTVRHAGTSDQIAFWLMAHKYRAFVGGIGSGKTRAGALEVFRQPAGTHGMVVAPTYDMLKAASLETFFEIAESTGDSTTSLIREHSAGEMRTILKNGTRVRWRSGNDPTRLRGPNLNWWWIDEGAYLRDDAVFKTLVGRLRRANPVGMNRGWITTSPAGFNWLYEYFVERGLTDRYGLIHASTRSNVFLDPSFVEDLAAAYTSEYAAQEIEGRFVDLGDTLVKTHWIRHAPALSTAGMIVTMGVDLAISEKTSADYTAIVVVGRRPGSGLSHVLDATHERVSFHKGLALVRAMAQKWHPALIRIESVAFQEAHIAEMLRTTRLPIQGVPRVPGVDKIARFIPVATRYERGFIVHSPHLQGSEFEKHITGFPVAKHDDYADALELAMNLGYAGAVAVAGGKRPAHDSPVFGRYRMDGSGV